MPSPNLPFASSGQRTLLFGGTILTMDSDFRVIPEGEILLQGGKIIALGRNLTLLPGTRLVDISGQLVLPGLIQGHVHFGQTFFRGLGEGRKLLPWLKERIWPLEAAHDDESAYWCGLQGAAEALLSGTTTVQDIGLGPGAAGLVKAIRESRLGGFAGKCLMDSGDALPAGLLEETDACLADTESLGDRQPSGSLRYALNPRFILTCSDALLRGVRELADRRDWPVHIHALEQQEEVAAVKAQKNGRDEIEYFDDEGLLDVDLRIAHGVWLGDEHYRRLAGRRFSVIHCPSANLKLGSGVADVVAHRSAGIPVGLGCDGVACNNGLDALAEIRLAALLQANHHGPDRFSSRDALSLATIDGARALGLEDEIGSIEIGKRADLLVLSPDRPEMWAAPGVDPHDLVAFSASRANVSRVLIGGESVVEDGRLVHLDLEEIRQNASRQLDALLKRSGIEL